VACGGQRRKHEARYETRLAWWRRESNDKNRIEKVKVIVDAPSGKDGWRGLSKQNSATIC
jgi:hypothetical protein